MTGYNLPPGVSVDMIPGNRPIDAAWDSFYDEFDFVSAFKEWLSDRDDFMANILLSMIELSIDNELLAEIILEECEKNSTESPIEKWFNDWISDGD